MDPAINYSNDVLTHYENSKKKDEKKVNFFYFFTILYIFFIYGIILSSFGVALTTLKNLFKLDSLEIGFGLSFQAIGGCVSSVLATYTLDKWNRQKQLSFYLFFLSILILIFPFSISPITFYALNGMIGFFCLTIDCIVNIWVVEIFRKNANIYLQILHFFFPFGSFFSSLIFGPFLNKEKILNEEIFNNEDITKIGISSLVSFPSNEDEKFIIWIPFAFCSFLFFVGFLLLTISYIIKPYKEIDKKKKTHDSNNNDEINSTNSNEQIEKKEFELKSKNISKKYYVFFVAIISIFVTLEVGSETNAINFLPTFLNKSGLHLSEQKSAYVSSIFTFFFFIGRFLSIIISYKIPTEVYLYINFGLMFAGNFILLLFSQSSLILVYIGIALAGLGFSSTYPLTISFVEERISLTNKISSIMAFSSVVYLTISPIVISSLIEEFPIYFIYISFSTTILYIGIFIFLHILEIIRLKKK